ncbi:MAG: hypothetical protein J07HQX50_00313 [Haloquadratum sp. J07HQX50]|jgi:hypothetical protein|nr:MAG: hypothetical protein J07HQX50_00313 [Haloquadratum sp. J07HQX50]
MYGVVTRNADEVEWEQFGRGFYEVKDVTGRAAQPLTNAVNMISCFGDTAAANSDPQLVPVDDAGNRATRDQRYFDWAYICPTHQKYQTGLLEIISDSAEANPAVRLDDVGFPREGYCRCERCTRLFEASDHEDWPAWRADIITEFVEEAVKLIPDRSYLTLYPDPYPSHLYERAGLDLDALSELIDEFVIPLYDIHYATTYWLEALINGFQTRFADSTVSLAVELYAVEVDIDNLVQATNVAEVYADGVYFGYDASNAAAALRRKHADNQSGETYGP